MNIWRCFSDDDEYNEDQHDIIEQIQQLQQELDQTKTQYEQQSQTYSSSNEQLRILLEKYTDIFVS